MPNWSFYQRVYIYIKVTMTYCVYFPALFLHELSHYLVARLLGARIVKVFKFPKVIFMDDGRTYKIVYASVVWLPKGKIINDGTYRPTPILDKISLMLVNIAPLTLLTIPTFILYCFGVLQISPLSIIHPSWLFKYENIWFYLICLQVLWGFWPSKTDWSGFLKGYFSFTGTVLTILISICVVVYLHNKGIYE